MQKDHKRKWARELQA